MGRVRATVVSRPTPDRAILAVGSRTHDIARRAGRVVARRPVAARGKLG